MDKWGVPVETYVLNHYPVYVPGSSYVVTMDIVAGNQCWVSFFLRVQNLPVVPCSPVIVEYSFFLLETIYSLIREFYTTFRLKEATLHFCTF